MSIPFLGQLMLFPMGYAPRGWTPCNGQLLPINQYQALFSLLGTTYGGDGRTTFGLPNLQGRTPVMVGGGIGLGNSGGEETHTLSLLEMPSHTHNLMAVPGNQDAIKPDNHSLATTVPNGGSMLFYKNSNANASLNPATISLAGGSAPHENRQPYLVMNWCIALTGIFPSRN